MNKIGFYADQISTVTHGSLVKEIWIVSELDDEQLEALYKSLKNIRKVKGLDVND